MCGSNNSSMNEKDCSEADLEYLKRQWHIMDGCKGLIFQSTFLIISLSLSTSAMFITNKPGENAPFEKMGDIFITIQVLCVVAGAIVISNTRSRWKNASEIASRIEINHGFQKFNDSSLSINGEPFVFAASWFVIAASATICSFAVWQKING